MQLLQDLEEIKAVPWDLAVLDERLASRSFAQKMYPVLHDLQPQQRVSVRATAGDVSPEQLLAWAAFLDPGAVKVRRRRAICSFCIVPDVCNSGSAECADAPACEC